MTPLILAAAVSIGLIADDRLPAEALALVPIAVAALDSCPAAYEVLDVAPVEKLVVFKAASGREQKSCAVRGVVATTNRNGGTVWLCVPQINRLALQRPEDTVIFLMHEILHTQGLGESPVHKREKTSREITRVLRKACMGVVEEVLP